MRTNHILGILSAIFLALSICIVAHASPRSDQAKLDRIDNVLVAHQNYVSDVARAVELEYGIYCSWNGPNDRFATSDESWRGVLTVNLFCGKGQSRTQLVSYEQMITLTFDRKNKLIQTEVKPFKN